MDKDNVITTPYPVPVGYINEKRTQQTVMKKNGVLKVIPSDYHPTYNDTNIGNWLNIIDPSYKWNYIPFASNIYFEVFVCEYMGCKYSMVCMHQCIIIVV